MPARRTLLAVVAVLLLVFAAVVGGAVVLFSNFTQPVEESYTYEYRASVTPNATLTNATLTNATLYLPVPAAANETRIGAAVVDPASAPNATVTRDATPSYSLVDTADGPMLAVRAERVPAKTRTVPDPTPLPTSDGPTTADPAPGNHSVTNPYRVVVTLRTTHSIDTRSPVGTEPVLVPRRNAVDVSCGDPGAGDATCRRFESAVYADYDAPANASVEVFVSLTGSNWWFAGGWRGNEYHQSGAVVLTGSRSEWTAVNVTERVGFGTY